MAVLEIVQPALKKELISEFREVLVPELFTKLQAAGALQGYIGTVMGENGKDVSEENKQILFIEWPARQNFSDFTASAGFKEVGGKLKARYAEAPAHPKLFENAGEDVSAVLAGGGGAVAYLRVLPKDPSNADALLARLREEVPKLSGHKAVAIGSSANLDTVELAVVSLFGSKPDLDAARGDAARQKFLAEISESAEVTSYITKVEKKL